MKPPQETRQVKCTFPDPDLLSSLVDLYFTYSNAFMPLLHRPTFEKAVADNLHQQEVQFAATVLLVCAIGVRFSEDPRVTNVPYDHYCSLGWIWFYQSQEMHQSVLYKPSLHAIQCYCVSCVPQTPLPTQRGFLALCDVSGGVLAGSLSLDLNRCGYSIGTGRRCPHKAQISSQACSAERTVEAGFLVGQELMI